MAILDVSNKSFNFKHLSSKLQTQKRKYETLLGKLTTLGTPVLFYPSQIHILNKYRTDANNNRTFCIDRTRLVTVENGGRKWILAHFTIEIDFISNPIQGKKGLENNNNHDYYWRYLIF